MFTSLFLSLTLAAAAQAQQQLAFPGAEGFGRFATGGRAGNICTVSNLNDNGAGSLRDCLSQPDRIVNFSVGGTIKISERLIIPKRTSILGETAPSPGITIYGNGVSASNADDSIVRYVKIRMGRSGTAKKDALAIADGYRMIFDHCSISFGRDETFSINTSKGGNITIQNSIIAMGLETHSCGGLMQAPNDNDSGISLFRNLYIDNKTRNPKVKGRNDFRNNVVYNWGSGGGYIAGGDSSGTSEVIIAGNYFISGPNTGSTKPFVRGNADHKAFVNDNFWDSDRDGALNGKALASDSASYGGCDILPTAPAFPGPDTMLPAALALDQVLADAGASNFRDAVDARLVEEVRSYGKVGQFISDENSGVMAGLVGKLATP
jgi:pectate lyase